MILVLNIGSTSIKYKVFKTPSLELVESFSVSGFSSLEGKLSSLLENATKYPIEKVGHRVVHGGDMYSQPTAITKNTLNNLRALEELAPLHNPFNIKGIMLAERYFPKAKHIAVFDTGFFANLPEIAKRYAIPNVFYTKHGIKKFGFHGISHEYALAIAGLRLKKRVESLTVITCHLGGGSSITAIKNGTAIDTTMGYTPLAGVPMLTRSGNVDPGIILELLMNKKYGVSPHKLFDMLYHESGLKGIAGISNYLDILLKKGKNKGASLAFQMYVYNIQKEIGAFYAVLEKLDALVFTGAIGAGKSTTRNAIAKGLPFLKKVPLIAVAANEEFIIAKKIISM